MSAPPKPGRKRLDQLLVERGLAETRQRAQALILAGAARVNGQRVDKAGTLIRTDARVEIAGEGLKYASRGGLKLEGALEDSALDVAGSDALHGGGAPRGLAR